MDVQQFPINIRGCQRPNGRAAYARGIAYDRAQPSLLVLGHVRGRMRDHAAEERLQFPYFRQAADKLRQENFCMLVRIQLVDRDALENGECLRPR